MYENESEVLVTQSFLTLCDPMNCPWNSPGKNTGVSSHSLLQGIFLAQGSNPGLLHCRWTLHSLNHEGNTPLCMCTTTPRKELTPFLLKLFQKLADEGKLPNSFCKATITIISKSDKDATQKRKLQANITDEHRCKNPQQDFSKPNSATHQKADAP